MGEYLILCLLTLLLVITSLVFQSPCFVCSSNGLHVEKNALTDLLLALHLLHELFKCNLSLPLFCFCLLLGHNLQLSLLFGFKQFVLSLTLQLFHKILLELLRSLFLFGEPYLFFLPCLLVFDLNSLQHRYILATNPLLLLLLTFPHQSCRDVLFHFDFLDADEAGSILPNLLFLEASETFLLLLDELDLGSILFLLSFDLIDFAFSFFFLV